MHLQVHGPLRAAAADRGAPTITGWSPVEELRLDCHRATGYLQRAETFQETQGSRRGGGGVTVVSPLPNHHLAEPPSTWRGGVAELLGPVEIGRLDGEVLSGDLTSRSLGSLGVSRMTGGPAVIRQAPRMSTREHPGCIQVWLLLQGRAALSQDGRQADVMAGDLVVCDAGQPYELAFPGVHRTVLVTMPSESVQVRLGGTAALTARSISGRHGAGALVARLLTGLAEQLDESELPWGLHLSIAVTAMLEAMFAEQ